jgi:hypothetical protein
MIGQRYRFHSVPVVMIVVCSIYSGWAGRVTSRLEDELSYLHLGNLGLGMCVLGDDIQQQLLSSSRIADLHTLSNKQ